MKYERSSKYTKVKKYDTDENVEKARQEVMVLMDGNPDEVKQVLTALSSSLVGYDGKNIYFFVGDKDCGKSIKFDGDA